jgi:hypothetical protein
MDKGILKESKQQIKQQLRRNMDILAMSRFYPL